MQQVRHHALFFLSLTWVSFHPSNDLFRRSPLPKPVPDHAGRQTETTNGSGDTLLLLTVLMRHGDRSPTHVFPNNPNKGKWPEGTRQLTKLGRRQAYEAGRYIRREYHPFLHNFSPRVVRAHSSDSNHTIGSASSFLAGLFSSLPEDRVVDHEPCQPVPIHTVPPQDDYVMNHDARCPVLGELVLRQVRSKEMTEIAEKYKFKELFELLTNKTGKTISELFKAANIYNTLTIEMQNNLTIPDWATDNVLARMKVCHDLKFILKAKSRQMVRIRGGALLKKIMEYMDSKISGKLSKLKLTLWSTHNTMLSSMLLGMEFEKLLFLPPATLIIAELHKSPTDGVGHQIRMFYKEDGVRRVELVIPGCDRPCSFARFKHLTADIIPDDTRHECGGDQPDLVDPYEANYGYTV